MKIEIDPLYFLVSLEACLVLFIVTLFLLVQNRKYKKLYRKSLKDRESAQKTLPEEAKVEVPSPAAVPDEPVEAGEEAAPVLEPAAAPEAASWDDVMPVAAGEPSLSESDLPANVRRLQRMVVFQKNTILELMCYKEIFEGTQRRLDALRTTNSGLQEKLMALNDGNVEVLGLSEPLNTLESTNHDVEKFINVLGKENSMLSEKFTAWEEEFRRIAEDLEGGDEAPAAGAGTGGGLDEARYTELLQEKEDLERKIGGYEERLKEQTKQLDEIQKQYEDLEKEYMILYRQQQQQQQQQQGA